MSMYGGLQRFESQLAVRAEPQEIEKTGTSNPYAPIGISAHHRSF